METPYDVGPETGVYLRPGQTLTVENHGPDAGSIREFAVSGRNVYRYGCSSVGPARRISRNTHRKAFGPESLADCRSLVSSSVDDEIGSEQVTQFVGSIPPGRAPDHFHEYEEVLFILRGEGRMWAGETNTPIAPGSCIYLPKRQVHCVENTGTGELRLLGVFYPAGSPAVRYEE